MRKLFLTWAAAVAAVALVGCKEDNPEPVPAPVITLESESTVSFFAAGGNGEIKYSIANSVEGVTLHADCEADWVTDVTAGEPMLLSMSLKMQKKRSGTQKSSSPMRAPSLLKSMLLRLLPSITHSR
jgi:lipoprotein